MPIGREAGSLGGRGIAPTPVPVELKDLAALVVDDDSLTRETLCMILAKLGLERTVEAQDGEEALRTMRREEVDVVLTDIHMPGMDGLALLKEVRKNWPTVPVVVLTGFPSIEIAIKAMKEGASDFLMKPFQIEQLELLMERTLKERRLLLEHSRLSRELQQKKEIERLNHYLNRKLKETSVLYSISEAFQSIQMGGEELMERVVEMANEITEAQKVSLMLVDDESNHLMVKAARGIEERIWRETKVPIGEGIAGRVAIEGKARFIRDLKEQGLTAAQEVGPSPTRSMISVPLMIRGEIFGVLNVADKARDKRFLEEDLTLLKALVQKAALTIENQALYESIYTTLTDTLFSLVTTIEAKDPYTRDHSQRVTQWAVQVAEALQVGTEEIDGIRFAGYLHDIGKIGIPDSILMKSTRLTADEEAIIRTHPIIGERIVKPLGLLPLESSLIRHHHERWDGEGYPDGLRGEEIPLAARILAVADTYDAITTNRTYREGRKAVHALKELESSVGRQFDRRVVLAFRDVVLDRGENLHSAAQQA